MKKIRVNRDRSDRKVERKQSVQVRRSYTKTQNQETVVTIRILTTYESQRGKIEQIESLNYILTFYKKLLYG